MKYLYCIEHIPLYTMSREIDLIQDLLPHDNILNFHAGIPTLPLWARDIDSLSLMIGAGDYKQGGMLNIQRFSQFDVFVCYPYDDNGSLRENVVYFKSLQQNKLLCFIDFNNAAHVSMFTSLFKEKFNRIEGHGGHTPHLKPVHIGRILCEGGTATNIFEMSSNISSVQMVEKWLRNIDLVYGRFGEGDSYIGSGHIFRISAQGYYENALTPPENFMMKELFIEKIKEKNRMNGQVHVDIPYFEMIDTWTLIECQTVLAGLLHDADTPLMLRGTIRPFIPAWSDIERVELIYTKEMPKFKPDMIECYIEEYGEEDELVSRLYKIHDAIQEDIENMCIWQAKAKYKTYRKYSSMMMSKLSEDTIAPIVFD